MACQGNDRQVLPTLARLERTPDAVIWWPWLGQRALAERPPARGRNVMAGVLMRTAVSLGLVSYLRNQPAYTLAEPRATSNSRVKAAHHFVAARFGRNGDLWYPRR